MQSNGTVPLLLAMVNEQSKLIEDQKGYIKDLKGYIKHLQNGKNRIRKINS